MSQDRVYSVEATAILLNKSVSFVYRTIKSGGIAAARVGSNWRIPASEIARLLRPVNGVAVAAFKHAQINRQEAARDRDILRGLKDKFRDAGI